jgi:hypothetical protein
VDLYCERVWPISGWQAPYVLWLRYRQIQVEGGSCPILEAEFQCIASLQQPGNIISREEPGQQLLEGYLPP